MNIETKTKKRFVWIVGLTCVLAVLMATSAQAQVKVGDNPTTIDARSVLELESTTQGLYLPRLSTAQLAAVSGWKEGMVVYNTDDDCIKIYDGSTWECVGSDYADGDAWGVTGEAQGVDISRTGQVTVERTSAGTTASQALSSYVTRNLSDVVGSGVAMSFRGTSSNGTNYPAAQIRGVKGADHTSFISGELKFDVVGAAGSYLTAATIDNAGNLGIGDETPDAKLDVEGSFRLDGTFADKDGDVGTAGQILSSTATGTDWIAAPSGGTDDQNIANLGLVSTTLTVGIEDGTSQTVDLAGLQDGDAWGVTGEAQGVDISRTGQVTVERTSAGTAASQALSSYVTRNLSDVVGSGVAMSFRGTSSNGTNYPAAQIRGVKGADHTSFISGELKFDVVGAAGSYLTAATIDNAGNLGIGDETPDAKLDVEGSFRLDGTFADKDGDVGTSGQILSSTATGTDWIAAPSGGTDDQNIANLGLVNTTLTVGIEDGTSQTVDLAGLQDGDAWGVTGEAQGVDISRTGQVTVERTSAGTAASQALSSYVTRNLSDVVGSGVAMSFRGTSSNGTNYPAAQIRGVKGADHTSFISGELKFDVVGAAGSYLTAATIDNAGNLGIGTENPNATLDVNGSLAFSSIASMAGGDYTLDAGTNPDRFVINPSSANHAANITLTLTAATTASNGRVITVVNGNQGAGAIEFSGATIVGTLSQVNPGASISLINFGTSWYIYSSF